ncbi:hypothetical protein WISP_125139 [Willisornis vidua]|uniref:Uncharacterized protein n=1 Tax=Willisornis vidua TaxID=1566151 RepID=A0ABQ9CWP7_9PASS|nr:hypothetical protein WISP_125139 [Willisornis vidua]
MECFLLALESLKNVNAVRQVLGHVPGGLWCLGKPTKKSIDIEDPAKMLLDFRETKVSEKLRSFTNVPGEKVVSHKAIFQALPPSTLKMEAILTVKCTSLQASPAESSRTPSIARILFLPDLLVPYQFQPQFPIHSEVGENISSKLLLEKCLLWFLDML